MGLELAKAFVRVGINTQAVASGMDRTQSMIGNRMSGIVRMITSKWTMLVGAIGGGLGLFSSIMAAGKFEQTQVAFETMIGSAEETKKTLADLTEFAALTPFEMPQIEQVATGLIQFGERGDDLMETLQILGDASGGTAAKFQILGLVFNQIRGVGKLLTQDFRQLATRGILSMQDLADFYKVDTGEAQKMLSAGKVSFEDVKGILKMLTAEGGRYHQMMIKQSKTLLGLWSTFKDAVGITARTFGTELLPVAKMVASGLIEMAEGARKFISNIAQSKRFVAAGILFQRAWEKIWETLQRVWKMQSEVFTSLLHNLGLASEASDGFAGSFEDAILSAIETVAVLTNIVAYMYEAYVDAITKMFSYLGEMLTWMPGKWLEAINIVLGYMDGMLGSWEGFQAGVIDIFYQIGLTFQAVWEQAKNFLAVTLLSMKGLFIDMWYALGEAGMKYAMPTIAKFFMWLQKKQVEASGGTWHMTPEEEADIIQDEQARALNKLADLRKENASDVAATQKKLDDDHAKRMAEIGQKSLDSTAKVMATFKKHGTLSGAIKEIIASAWVMPEAAKLDKKKMPSVDGMGKKDVGEMLMLIKAGDKIGISDLGQKIQDAMFAAQKDAKEAALEKAAATRDTNRNIALDKIAAQTKSPVALAGK